MSKKRASTDHLTHTSFGERWSPYTFQNRPVAVADLRSLFEAVRGSDSSDNKQTWSYVVVIQENFNQFQQLLLCLAAGDQISAKDSSELPLGIASHKFTFNCIDNE